MICGKSYSFRIRLPEEYAFAKTFESVFDEDTFFNSCLHYTHMEKIGLNAEMPIRTWFSRGFAGVLNEVSLQRIWDKVVGGSLIILVYVAVALVETSKMALMQCQTPKEGVRCLVSV